MLLCRCVVVSSDGAESADASALGVVAVEEAAEAVAEAAMSALFFGNQEYKERI